MADFISIDPSVEKTDLVFQDSQGDYIAEINFNPFSMKLEDNASERLKEMAENYKEINTRSFALLVLEIIKLQNARKG